MLFVAAFVHSVLPLQTPGQRSALSLLDIALALHNAAVIETCSLGQNACVDEKAKVPRALDRGKVNQPADGARWIVRSSRAPIDIMTKISSQQRTQRRMLSSLP